MVPLSLIGAIFLRSLLKAMMRSDNDTISNAGMYITGAMFLIGIVMLIYYKSNGIPLG